MYKRLISFILKNNVLYPEQFGFLKGRSTEQAMLDILSRITGAIELKKLSLGIFLDLSKAFDTLSHDILISKLHRYGFRGLSGTWLKNYLHNRKQYVQTGQALSSLQNITSGVPQGSVLGPLLFLMYINDMPSISSVMNYILFADDTNALYTSPSIDDLFVTVNNELEKLNQWFSANRLSINVKKTHAVLFMTHQKERHVNLNQSSHCLNINNSKIELKDYVKFLGLFLDKNLKFDKHIQHINYKLSKSICTLSRTSKVFNSNTLKTLYSSFILPYLNYGLLAWGGLSKIDTPDNKLLQSNSMKSLSSTHILQKRSLRILSKSPHFEHHIPICSRFNLLDLQDLYHVKALTFLHDFYHGKLPPFFQINYSSIFLEDQMTCFSNLTSVGLA